MNRRAVSLLEVLIAAALILTVLAVAVKVFVPAVETWNTGQQRSTAQQQVFVAARWLRTDIEKALPGSFRWQDERLSMLGPGDPLEYDDFGRPRWREVISYYLDDQDRLRRQTEALPDDADPRDAVPGPIDPEARVISREMETFEVEVQASWRLLYRLSSTSGESSCALETETATRLAPIDLKDDELQAGG